MSLDIPVVGDGGSGFNFRFLLQGLLSVAFLVQCYFSLSRYSQHQVGRSIRYRPTENMSLPDVSLCLLIVKNVDVMLRATTIDEVFEDVKKTAMEKVISIVDEGNG